MEKIISVKEGTNDVFTGKFTSDELLEVEVEEVRKDFVQAAGSNLRQCRIFAVDRDGNIHLQIETCDGLLSEYKVSEKWHLYKTLNQAVESGLWKSFNVESLRSVGFDTNGVKIVESKFVNLTPHDIALNNGRVFPTSGTVARVSAGFSEFSGDFCCQTFGDVTGLPAPVDGVFLIVSGLVFDRTDRADVVAPATGHPLCVRNDKGHIVSVPGFLRKEAIYTMRGTLKTFPPVTM